MAFDSITQQKIVEALSECRVDHRYSAIIKRIYENDTAYVRISANQCRDKFNMQSEINSI